MTFGNSHMKDLERFLAPRCPDVAYGGLFVRSRCPESASSRSAIATRRVPPILVDGSAPLLIQRRTVRSDIPRWCAT